MRGKNWHERGIAEVSVTSDSRLRQAKRPRYGISAVLAQLSAFSVAVGGLRGCPLFLALSRALEKPCDHAGVPRPWPAITTEIAVTLFAPDEAWVYRLEPR